MNWQEYIQPELLLQVPVIYLIGMALKGSEHIKDKHIPFYLGLVGIVLTFIYSVITVTPVDAIQWITAGYTAIIQGILCAGAAVFTNQSIKQLRKDGE